MFLQLCHFDNLKELLWNLNFCVFHQTRVLALFGTSPCDFSKNTFTCMHGLISDLSCTVGMIMSLWNFLIFLFFLVHFEEVESFNVDLRGLSDQTLTMRSALEKNGEEIVTRVLDQVIICNNLSCYTCWLMRCPGS